MIGIDQEFQENPNSIIRDPLCYMHKWFVFFFFLSLAEHTVAKDPTKIQLSCCPSKLGWLDFCINMGSGLTSSPTANSTLFADQIVGLITSQVDNASSM